VNFLSEFNTFYTREAHIQAYDIHNVGEKICTKGLQTVSFNIIVGRKQIPECCPGYILHNHELIFGAL
jgi:hypothetical protein